MNASTAFSTITATIATASAAVPLADASASRHPQQQRQRVGELTEEFSNPAALVGARDLVAAELRQAPLRLTRGQTDARVPRCASSTSIRSCGSMTPTPRSEALASLPPDRSRGDRVGHAVSIGRPSSPRLAYLYSPPSSSRRCCGSAFSTLSPSPAETWRRRTRLAAVAANEASVSPANLSLAGDPGQEAVDVSRVFGCPARVPALVEHAAHEDRQLRGELRSLVNREVIAERVQERAQNPVRTVAVIGAELLGHSLIQM